MSSNNIKLYRDAKLESNNLKRNTNASDDLVRLAQVTDNGGVVTMESVISDYINPDFMDNLHVFGIKVAENGLINNARILQKLDELLSELLIRLSPEAISELPDEVLTQKIALLFEMQNRYQMLIDKVLTEDRYTYFMENLQALRRVMESRATTTQVNEGIYAPELDRRVIQELLTDLRSALDTRESINELVVEGGSDE